MWGTRKRQIPSKCLINARFFPDPAAPTERLSNPSGDNPDNLISHHFKFGKLHQNHRRHYRAHQWWNETVSPVLRYFCSVLFSIILCLLLKLVTYSYFLHLKKHDILQYYTAQYYKVSQIGSTLMNYNIKVLLHVFF